MPDTAPRLTLYCVTQRSLTICSHVDYASEEFNPVGRPASRAILLSQILHYILHRLHFDSYISGYSEFHLASRLHRKFPFVVYSAGT